MGAFAKLKAFAEKNLSEEERERFCAPFMTMGRLNNNGRVIHTYKHSDTRRYLNLDDELNTYSYDPTKGYLSIPLIQALNHVKS